MLQVTVEPSIFHEKEIDEDPEFEEVRKSFTSWSPDNKGMYVDDIGGKNI